MSVRFSKRMYGKRMAGLIVACMFLAGCFATSTRVGPPPMEKRPGTAPTAAFLPIGCNNDAEVTRYVTEMLKTCLEERNVLTFVDPQKVQQVTDASGYNFGKMFGLKSDEYMALGQKLGVDYTLHGTLGVKKSLTFKGWRKDVDLYLYINDGKTGKKVGSWRSMTDFTWSKTEAALSAEKMAESVVNHTCSKMLQRQY